MRKLKTVDNHGKITVTKAEERYPYSSQILMRHGFFIIFLNMALGLLPVTIWGTRMKYFKCSISQMYTTLFCLCFIILSVIFVPVVFFPKADERNSLMNMVILVLMGMVHIVGYICLLIRGHFVAKNIPIIWTQLSKLLQIAILDVYGTNCYLLNEARSFTRWALSEYIGVMFFTTGSFLAISEDFYKGIDESRLYYKLNIFVWPLGLQTGYQKFQYWCFYVGYFIWKLCSSSHLLVTMLICYIVIVIMICLKSVNQQIHELKAKFSLKRSDSGIFLPRVQFSANGSRSLGSGSITSVEHEAITNQLNTITKVLVITEEITQEISKVWGVSLIVEALILIAAGTVNSYDFLAMFQEEDDRMKALNSNGSNIVKFSLPGVDEWIGIFVTISTHFFFLFKLASMVNKMIDESSKLLHTLKQMSVQNLPQVIRDQVQILKQDISSCTICITASNFFSINKFLITSITSQIATYVIVLMQFAQQEKASGTSE